MIFYCLLLIAWLLWDKYKDHKINEEIEKIKSEYIQRSDTNA